MNVQNLSDTLKLFCTHYAVSAFPLKKLLVPVLSETCALTSRTNVAEKSMTFLSNGP